MTEEGLDVIFRKAIDLEHSIKPLKILNMMLECDLLLPTTCRVKAFRKANAAYRSTSSLAATPVVPEISTAWSHVW